MGYGWQPRDPPIQAYCQDLWEQKYCIHYHKICEKILIPLYQLLFHALVPCMSEKTMAVVGRIGGWYVMENGMYIRIYSGTKAPHLLPRFILDKLVL